jgi:hypothetical protein
MRLNIPEDSHLRDVKIIVVHFSFENLVNIIMKSTAQIDFPSEEGLSVNVRRQLKAQYKFVLYRPIGCSALLEN